MKSRWTGALAAIACSLTIGLSAQGTPTGGAQAQTPAKPGSASEKVTITGCLDKAQASSAPTGTTGAASTASMAKFVLKSATSGSGSSAAGAGTTGTTGAASASRSTASSYNLHGDDSKLSPHVGHKVEITGTVEEARAGSTPGAASTSASATPNLKVESVKMVASTCQ